MPAPCRATIASFKAFENAMSLDIAMGGSTNTVLHLLAAAHEGEVPFTMADIDRLSRRVPNLCKVAPSKSDVHMEDVHRAGGIIAILGELDRAGLIHPSCRPSTRPRWPRRWTAGMSVRRAVLPTTLPSPSIRPLPAACGRPQAFSQDRRYDDLDPDREDGVIRDVAHAFSQDGGLAVLSGNIALDGAIVKTAGVDPSHPGLHRPGADLREPGCRGRGHPGRQGQGRRCGGDPL